MKLKINYPKRSKFLQPIINAIQKNRKSLMLDNPITIQLGGSGYDDIANILIQKQNSGYFFTDWNNLDPTRFSSRIKAAAFALFNLNLYGKYFISHEEGILIIQQLSSNNNFINTNKKSKDHIITIKSNIYSSHNKNTNNNQIAQTLLKYGESIPREEKLKKLFPVLNENAFTLIQEDPFAFMLAAVLNRGVKAEIIWTIPYRIREVTGELNPQYFYNLNQDEIINLINELALPLRWLRANARTIKELSQLVIDNYNGDAAQIWNNNNNNIINTLRSIYGVGEGIASMIILLLKERGDIIIEPNDHRDMDVKADVHINRVFFRLGLIINENPEQAKNAARTLNPEYPGALDAPTWLIGRKWCHSNSPDCNDCIINSVCPKNIK